VFTSALNYSLDASNARINPAHTADKNTIRSPLE
jgi:hypothetical protein